MSQNRHALDMSQPRPRRTHSRELRERIARTGRRALNAGMLLLLPGAAWACNGDDGIRPPTETGRVRVAITGLQPGFTSAGSAVITGTGISTPINLPLLTTTTDSATVPIGEYHVVYTPPTGYAMASGQSNERDVTVVKDSTSDVTLGVVIATGSLTISVTGLEGATGGGTASVLRTDIAGQTPTIVTIPLATGTSTGSLVPGSYSVTYDPPTDFALVAGETNPKTATVSATVPDTVFFAVEENVVIPPNDVVFHSDFSTDLGTSPAALRDTDKEQPWTSINGNGTLNEVISSAGLDFPTANVLRVSAGFRSGGGAQAQTHRVDDAFPVPAIGQSLYYRWYIRVVIPDNYTADPGTHPIQDAGPSDQNWVFDVFTNTDGSWSGRYGVGATAHPNNHWGFNLDLQKGVTYRFEMRLLRTGANTFTLEGRVYNSADVLLYDNDDFENVNGTDNLSSAPTFNMFDPAHLDGMTAGFNGLSGGTSGEFPFIMYYQGAFCVRTQDWCGPYAGGI